MRFLERLQPLALLALRLALGGVMVGHGYQKVFGGMTHYVEFIRHLGIPGWLAYCSAGAEFFGGIAIFAGLFTRVAALVVFVDMAVALLKVDLKSGFPGYELSMTLAAVAFALIFFGAGAISLDHVFRGGSKS